MVLAEQLVVAQNVELREQSERNSVITGECSANTRASTHLLVLVHAAQHLFGDKLLQVRDRRLRTAADEAALQCRHVAHALQADVHLLVAPVVVGLHVRLVQAIEGVVIGAGRQILRARQVTALVELALALRLV